MKHMLVVLVVAGALAALAPGRASAQGNLGLNVGAEFVLPIDSPFKDIYNLGFGGTIRGEYGVTRDFWLMLSAGYISLSSKSFLGITPASGTMVPIVVGAKYYFMPGTLRFYGAFDLGITSFTQSVEVLGFNLASQTSTEFTWEPQLGLVGMFADNAAFDFGVRWIGISSANSLGIRLGVLYVFGGMKTSGPAY